MGKEGILSFWKGLPKHVKVQMWFLLLLPLIGLLVLLAAFFPDTVETVYAQTLRPVVMEPFSRLTGLLPFSLAEVLVLVLTVGIVIRLIFAIRKMVVTVKEKGKLSVVLVDYITRTVAVILVGVFLFQLLYGLCYHRKNTTASVNEYSFRYTDKDVVWILSYMVDDLNSLRREMGLEEGDTADLSMTVEELNRSVKQAYVSLSKEYPVYGGDYGNPKPVALSEPWTYTFVMGMYMPFTGEANYNTNIPAVALPHTVLHEMAHQRGIANEGEADFAGYLASRYCDDLRVRYSGLYVAVSSLLDVVKRMDEESYRVLVSFVDSGFLKEREEEDRFWQSYYTKLAVFSDDVNRAYLASNGTVLERAPYGAFDQYVMNHYVSRYLSEYIHVDGEETDG